MSIQQFAAKYSNLNTSSIKEIVKTWVAEKQTRDFLGTYLFSGVTVADILNGGLSDRPELPFTPEVRSAFKNLMKEKADTDKEIYEIFQEKLLKGDASVNGLKSKVQGQVGEDMFVKAVGDKATLAESGSQEGWDVAIDHGDHTQYVSVKVYSEPRGVIEKIREVNEKIAANDSGLAGASEIDFAVNSDIYEKVVALAQAQGLENKILDIGANGREMRELLLDASKLTPDHPLELFFGDLLDSAANVALVHVATQGLLLALGTKPFESALEDAAYSTAISVGGAGASLLTQAALIGELEFALGVLAGPVGGTIILAAGISARGVLKRFADRRFIVKRLSEGNRHLIELETRIANAA